MSWTRVFTVSTTIVLLVLSLSCVVENAAVRDDSKPTADSDGPAQKVFVPDSDASNFFKRRSRRSTRYYEALAEQRVKVASTERWRENNEEQMDEYEQYTREYYEETSERTREVHEQLREFNYDGQYPRFYWFH